MPMLLAEVEPEVTLTAMETLMSNLTSVFTAVIGYVGTVAETIADEPLLLLFVLIPLIGLGVGLFKRLLNVN